MKTSVDVETEEPFEGSNDPFLRELKPHVDYLRNFARKLTGCRAEANDLFQDTFVRLRKKFHMYERGTNFRAWASQVMKFLWFDERKKEKRRKNREEAYACEKSPFCKFAKQWCCPFNQALTKEEYLKQTFSLETREALDLLDDKYRRAILMYSLHGFSYEEIADELDCALGTVRSRIHRARTKLKEHLE